MSEPGEPRPPKGATQLPPKREVAIALLQTNSVFVHLDPRHKQVRVPAWFKKQPRLVLQVGLNMAVAIRDLDVGEQALSGTLSFSHQPFFCYIPWQAVFALVNEDGRGMVWPDDVPPEIVAQAEKQQEVAKRRSRMRAVAEPNGQPSSTESDASSGAPSADASAEQAEPASATPPPAAAPPEAKDETATSSPAAAPPDADGVDAAADTGALSQAEPPSKAEPSSKKVRTLPPYLRIVK